MGIHDIYIYIYISIETSFYVQGNTKALWESSASLVGNCIESLRVWGKLVKLVKSKSQPLQCLQSLFAQIPSQFDLSSHLPMVNTTIYTTSERSFVIVDSFGPSCLR